MKSFFLGTLVVLLLVPAAALAARPGQWTGPYVGLKVGLNHSSADGISSENAFTAGIYGGYDWMLSRSIVFGGSIFYLWNQDTGHDVCFAGVCGNVNGGSNVYGVDGRIGFPMGRSSQFMPYLKIGYAHIDLTGDFSGDDTGWRFGAGFEWQLAYNTSLTFEYTHADYGDDVGNWDNNNLTVGVNFRF
ncbi:MAG: porin family protein [Gammaproteobacteria bacterium]|nr:porin family protein [Gammaproteobacteria bacterium]